MDRAGDSSTGDDISHHELNSIASTMNHFTGSIALVRHPEQLENLWLAHWNASRKHYDFVTAERLDDESFRECLDREVAWILDIRRDKDYIVSSQARLHHDLPIQVSDVEIFYVV